MHKDATIKCPDCGATIVVDLATGRIVRHRAKGEAADADLFGKAVSQVETRDKDEGKLTREQERLRQRETELEQEFERKRREAEKDPNPRPPEQLW